MKKYASRLLPTLLVLCMALALLPGAALADGEYIDPGYSFTYTGPLSQWGQSEGMFVYTTGDYSFTVSPEIPAGDTAGLYFLDNGGYTKCEGTWDGDTFYVTMEANLYYCWKHTGRSASAEYTVTFKGKGAAPSTPTPTPTPSPAPSFKIEPSPQKLSVDGKNIECERYNIDGNNYFKLRDLAELLDRTGSQFEVEYDNAAKMIIITTGAPYTQRNGTELVVRGDKSDTAQVSGQTVQIDGVKYNNLKVYNIGETNFFQLRELNKLLNFEVDYNDATKTAIVNSVKK